MRLYALGPVGIVEAIEGRGLAETPMNSPGMDGGPVGAFPALGVVVDPSDPDEVPEAVHGAHAIADIAPGIVAIGVD